MTGQTRTLSPAGSIFPDENGLDVGNYGDCILRSAYQPIYSYGEGRKLLLSGYEGLIRVYKQDEVISPEEFFTTIPKEDRLYIECMCSALHIRNFKHIKPGGKKLFINVNVANYASIEALETEIYFIFSQLPKHGLNRDLAVFEILETEVMQKEILTRICEMFRGNGFRFALDDFGTQYSNLERYIELRPDIIKLDRSLFRTTVRIKEAENLLRALVHAMQDNGSTILIEGLETAEEIALAQDMKVDMFQGFELGRPKLLPAKFDEVLESHLHSSKDQETVELRVVNG